VFVIVWLARRLVLLVLLLAIPAVAGELIARKLVSDTVGGKVTAQFGGKPSVDFGSTPLLLQLLRGRVNLSVSEPDASVAGLPPVALHADFENIRVTSLLGLHGVIGTVTAHATLGPKGVGRLLLQSGCAGALPVGMRSALSAGSRIVIGAGHMTVLARRGAQRARIVPTAIGGRVAFNVVGASAGSAPPAGGSGCVATLGGLPFNLSLASAIADGGVLDLAFTGRGARFSG